MSTKKLLTDWVDIDVAPLNPPHPHFALEEKLGFLCAPLTAPQYLNCSQAMTGDAAIMAIRYAARDWRGVAVSGAPAKFSQRNIDRLFEDVRLIGLLGELGGKIIERSFLTEDERKNS